MRSVVVGGLVVSTIFTLILVPSMLSLMFDFRKVVMRALGRQPEPAEGQAG